MSQASSEDSLDIQRPSRAPTAASAAVLNDLSDDSSDDGRPHPVSRPARPARSASPRSRSATPPRTPSSPVAAGSRASRRPLPSETRRAPAAGGRHAPVDVLHFPPNIAMREGVAGKLERVPEEQNPILYRLRPGVRGERAPVEAVLDAVRECRAEPWRLTEFLQSNANVITWSDGSRTLAIGSQQFLLIEDAMASRHFVFRKGDGVQTCESGVRSVARVQPASTNDARTKLAIATAAMKAASKRREGRTMMRCMDDTGEQQEMKAKEESHRKQRERARLEAKRRQVRERNVRPNRALTVDALESDLESEEENLKRIADKVDAERLMRAKRAPPPRTMEVSAKRRRAGGKRVLGSDEDDSDDSD